MEEDRIHWDDQYAALGMAPIGPTAVPPVFAAYENVFPRAGSAIELGCGRGRCAVWLTARGLTCWGLDISPVAVDLARKLADRSGVGDRCRFDVVDLDDGLPDGPPVDVMLCHFFRDARLDELLVERLLPGGLLAIAAVSEVDVGPGPFRMPPGELRAAFAGLELIAEGEASGKAWLLARA